MFFNLLTLIEYLREHHDVMFILPGGNGALMYDPLSEDVEIFWGDFQGSREEQSAEMDIAMQRKHAWMQ